MKPHELRAAEGARKKSKRKGRGEGSGKGKTAGRGTKGTKARGEVHLFFEGGQMPIARRLPKLKGFTPPNQKVYGAINVGDLEQLDQSEVGPEDLHTAGLVHKRDKLIKVLGNGDLSKKLTVRAHAFSASARSKIEGAGGTAEIISTIPSKKDDAPQKKEDAPQKKEDAPQKKEDQ